jgi:cytochrome o ubiquinol oxidase subunit IV
VLIVFLVVVGSLWIMTNLNGNMMPPPELMNMHVEHRAVPIRLNDDPGAH